MLLGTYLCDSTQYHCRNKRIILAVIIWRDSLAVRLGKCRKQWIWRGRGESEIYPQTSTSFNVCFLFLQLWRWSVEYIYLNKQNSKNNFNSSWLVAFGQTDTHLDRQTIGQTHTHKSVVVGVSQELKNCILCAGILIKKDQKVKGIK